MANQARTTTTRLPEIPFPPGSREVGGAVPVRPGSVLTLRTDRATALADTKLIFVALAIAAARPRS